MYFFLGAGTDTGLMDMGFAIGGGANPTAGEGRGRCQHKNSPDFTKNCMKLRKFYCVWAAQGVASASEVWYFLMNKYNNSMSRQHHINM